MVFKVKGLAMILSLQDLFSDKQSVTQSCASTHVLDLGVAAVPTGAAGAPKRDLGQGTKVPLLVQVVEAFAGLTGLTVALQTSDDAGFESCVTLASQEFDAQALKAGARLALPVVPGGAAKRFLRLFYTVNGSGTAGKVTAGLTLGNDETVPF